MYIEPRTDNPEEKGRNQTKVEVEEMGGKKKKTRFTKQSASVVTWRREFVEGPDPGSQGRIDGR